MENAIGILLVIIFLLIVMRPWLQRVLGPWLQRWALGKMEDRMRRMAGMPTRKEEKKARRQAARRESGGAARFRRAASGSRAHTARSRRAPQSTVDMLQTFAEDVEFTEVKSYSSEIEIGANSPSGGRKGRVVVEEQIEDAEYIEIKTEKK